MNLRNALALSIICAAAACGSEPRGANDNELTTAPLAVGNWSPPSNILQGGAFTTGKQSLNLPVCRAPFDGGMQPGKFWAGQCLFEWGGRGLAAGPNVPTRNADVSTFETLVNNGRMSWFAMNPVQCGTQGCARILQAIPQNAIDGGPAGSSAGNAPLPVCMGNYNDNQWHVGKWWANGCNIEFDRKGVHLTNDNSSLFIAVSN